MSRMGRTTYSVGSPTRVCAATGAGLNAGEPFVGVVAQSSEGDEFVRLDFSARAWDSGARPEKPLGVLGFWRSTVPEAGSRRRILIDDAALLDIFEQTGEPGSTENSPPGQLAFRFVLALLLIRKRLLVCESSRGKSMKVRARNEPGEKDRAPVVDVLDPGLDDARIAEVTEQLRVVLIDGEDPGERATPPAENTVHEVKS